MQIKNGFSTNENYAKTKFAAKNLNDAAAAAAAAAATNHDGHMFLCIAVLSKIEHWHGYKKTFILSYRIYTLICY